MSTVSYYYTFFSFQCTVENTVIEGLAQRGSRGYSPRQGRDSAGIALLHVARNNYNDRLLSPQIAEAVCMNAAELIIVYYNK